MGVKDALGRVAEGGQDDEVGLPSLQETGLAVIANLRLECHRMGLLSPRTDRPYLPQAHRLTNLKKPKM
jgi:hypothetical protein